MQLHLLCSPGEPSFTTLVEVAQIALAGKPDPFIAYLPAAAVYRRFVRENKALFRSVARLSALKPEIHTFAYMQRILEQADLLYIPGGNTYLLARRLYEAGLIEELRQRIQNGLPLLAISAGVVFCGRDILTTNDLNCCACTQFEGLGLVPYNFNMHYPPEDSPERQRRNEQLAEYHVFYDTPVLAMEEDAYLRVNGKTIYLVRGKCWYLQKGLLPVPLAGDIEMTFERKASSPFCSE